MYIDSSDVCQEVLKMFNLETYFIIKIEEMFSNKKKIDCSILYGTNRHYILGEVLKLSLRLK